MRFTASLIGVVLVILSVPVGFLTPFIPVGLPMAAAGLVLIGRNSRFGKSMIVATARRYPRARTLYLRRLRPVLATSGSRPLFRARGMAAAAPTT